MGINYNARQHAPPHNLTKKEEDYWIVRKFINLARRSGNTEEKINPKNWKMPADYVSEEPLPRPNQVPVVFVFRNNSEYKIEFCKFMTPSSTDPSEFDLEHIIVPLRGYNYKEIIGGHALFIDPKGDGENHMRYCDREHCGDFINEVLDEVENYLNIHGDVIYV
jgi:hypothetical protein